MTKCTLSGNLCTVLCKDIKTNCFYKKREYDGLTIGQLYFLLKNSQTKIIEDRDFLYRIIVGKSLIEEADDPDNLIYDPMENFGLLLDEKCDVENDLKIKKFNITHHKNYTGDSIVDDVYDIIIKKELPILEAKRADLEKAVQKSDKVPVFVRKTLRTLERGITSVQHYSFEEYFGKVHNYIRGVEDKYNKTDIKKILLYLILSFIQKDKNDFPMGLTRTTSKIMGKLIDKTKNLDDNHPRKWTRDRYNFMNSIDNPYRKFVIFDDFMYLWKIYCLGDIDVYDIEEPDICLKYILDRLIHTFSYKYVTDYIIFDTKGDTTILKRLCYVFDILYDIYEENIMHFSTPEYNNFFLSSQLDNQFVLHKIDDHEKLRIKLNNKYRTMTISTSDRLQFLKEQGLLYEVVII